MKIRIRYFPFIKSFRFNIINNKPFVMSSGPMQSVASESRQIRKKAAAGR